jgi:hypothetical protein
MLRRNKSFERVLAHMNGANTEFQGAGQTITEAAMELGLNGRKRS